MITKNIKVPLRDGEMGAYLAVPDRTPAGAIIAIKRRFGTPHSFRGQPPVCLSLTTECLCRRPVVGLCYLVAPRYSTGDAQCLLASAPSFGSLRSQWTSPIAGRT